MPLKLCKRIAMALQSDSMQFTTLVQNKCSISLSTLYPNCATEQLHGPAQLSLKSCIPLMTVLFHRGASLDRTVSSLISPLHSRALQQFSLAIQSPLRDSKDRVRCSWICKANKKGLACMAVLKTTKPVPALFTSAMLRFESMP